jgi:hypothetical protein
MAYSTEDLEQQRRLVAMHGPAISVKIQMTLAREVALRVITYAATLSRISIADKLGEDDGQAVA